MHPRFPTSSITLGLVIAVAASWSVATTGQSRTPTVSAGELPGTERVKAFIASRTRQGFTPSRTPWGDPDISGNFTTKDEANTPFERPEKWAGRRMEDITPEELAADIVERQQRAVEQAPFAGGGEPEQGVAIAVPIHWFDNLAAENARPWFVIDPADGRIPAMTAGARSPAAPVDRDVRLRGGRRDSYTDRSISDRCIAFSPWRTPIIYGNSYQILQTPDHVVLRYEMIHEARVIPIDGRPHASPDLRGYMGDSRGYWDGSSLVVETRNINPQVLLRGFVPTQGASVEKLRLIERFTRIAPDKVEWTTTFDDPTMFTRPWTYSVPMTEDDAQIIHEYACHEGNYGLANLLSAGRAEDDGAGKR